ncbi:MAG TPA: acyl-CoA dehydrogenase family protein, partial [Pyrinomonadaceae bacterium]
VCDSMATGAVRALHATPEQMRLYAAAVKYYVPTSVEEVIRRAGVILGARHYLREGHCAGAFQKLVRDSSVLSIFHSGTFLNLTTVGMYLGELANRRATAVRQSTEQIAQRVAAIFTLSHPLPAFDASRLKVYTRGRDDVLYGLPSTLSRLRRLKDSLTTFTDVQGEVRVEVQVEVLDEIIRLTTELCQEVEAEDARQREMEAQLGNAYGTSPEMFEQAGRYCVLHAAASCVHLWAHSRAHMEEFYRGGEWVVLGLARQLKKLRGVSEAVAAEYYERVAEQLERLHAEQRSFALVPLHLAQADRREVEELLSAAV